MNFPLYVSYSQIAVFDPRIDRPFNDWSDSHVKQGFAWRQGSVSFKTLMEAGSANVSVVVGHLGPIHRECVRAISVPFKIGKLGTVEIASISDSQRIDIGEGQYRLRFQTGFKNSDCWIILEFQPAEQVEAEIVVADSNLKPESQLLMIAEPA